MDESAVFQLTYGLFVIGSGRENKKGGCITNTAMQVNSMPIRVSVTIAKENETHDLVKETGRLSISVLSEAVDNKIFGTFGFRHSSEVDKWEAFEHGVDQKGVPYLQEKGVLSWLSGQVIQHLDVDTHTIFIIEMDEGENLEEGTPMSYAYYRKERRGHAPKAAPTHRAAVDEADREGPSGTNIGFKCDICGHIEKQGDLPTDYRCPVCTASRSHMHPIYKRVRKDDEKEQVMRCPVCGFTVSSDDIVSGYRCPLCGVAGENFVPKE